MRSSNIFQNSFCAVLVLAVVAYRRRNKSELEKQALFYDEDDIRENLQPYHEEGGEEDNVISSQMFLCFV